MIFQVLLDRLFQGPNAPERATADSFLGDRREESLDLVQPGAAGGREVQMILGMAEEPPLDCRGLVRSVVVHDHVTLDAGLLGCVRVDLVQNLRNSWWR